MNGGAITRVLREDTRTRLFRRAFRLEVLEGPDQGLSSESSRSPTIVGSSEASDLRLRDPAVSRFHLRIEHDPRGFRVSDLGSTNGTRLTALGGRRLAQLSHPLAIEQILIDSAARLRLGSSDLLLRPLAYETEVELAQQDRVGELVGCSPAMLELFARLPVVAQSEATVLLVGETGTGKGMVARELHRLSRRSAQPFVVVDCGALAQSISESELFGHAAGAFTGADQSRVGLLEQADGGTVFLDEIGELPLVLQTQLLRVLDDQRFRRVGETHERALDVRFIAATHRDLHQMVNQGAFRADLFFRLAVVVLGVPPLRRRPEDVELLFEHFIATLATEMARPPPELPDEMLQQLRQHCWPGNVREVRNFAERYLVSCDGDDLPALQVSSIAARPPIAELDQLSTLPFKQAKALWAALFDAEYLSRLLVRCQGNLARAAEQSGLSRVHVFRLSKKYGIDRAPESERTT